MPAMQGKLISAVEFKYDRHLTDVILDTIESNLIDELNTPENHENLKRLRSCLHRRWVDIKPFKMRHLRQLAAVRAITASILIASKGKENTGQKMVPKEFCVY
ncbi:hypothetical protein IMAU50079_02036 [Lactobacillus helveticus]|nr:hypothetical protein [Lactobacillus helveticus]